MEETKRATSPLAKNLLQLRKAKGWTYRKIAENAGISHVFYWEIERGQKSPTAETLMSLAKAFGVSMDELVGFEPVVKCERCNGKGYHERTQRAKESNQ